MNQDKNATFCPNSKWNYRQHILIQGLAFIFLAQQHNLYHISDDFRWLQTISVEKLFGEFITFSRFSSLIFHAEFVCQFSAFWWGKLFIPGSKTVPSFNCYTRLNISSMGSCFFHICGWKRIRIKESLLHWR